MSISAGIARLVLDYTGWASPGICEGQEWITEKYKSRLRDTLTKVNRLETELEAARRDISALKLRTSAEVDGFKPMDTAPMDGTPFNVRFLATLRYLPYKARSEQFKSGIKGRWQSVNDYGGWNNSPAPEADGWKPVKMSVGGKLVSDGEHHG